MNNNSLAAYALSRIYAKTKKNNLAQKWFLHYLKWGEDVISKDIIINDSSFTFLKEQEWFLKSLEEK